MGAATWGPYMAATLLLLAAHAALPASSTQQLMKDGQTKSISLERHNHDQNGGTSKNKRHLSQENIVMNRSMELHDAPKGRYPYAVSLRTQGVASHFCAGTLIAPQWVLTAAHCVDETLPRSFEKPLLYVGEYDMTSMEENEQMHETKEVIMHPSWNGKTRDGFDIALLMMKNPSLNVVTPHLADDNVGLKNLIILDLVGWHRKGSIRGARHTILQHIDLELISNRMCQNVFNTTIHEMMMCAGGFGFDSCLGDSGGLLVLSDAPNNDVEAGKPNLDYVVGISSFAPETCGQRTLPGVYTRVSMFSGWVAETIAKMSEGAVSQSTEDLNKDVLELAGAEEDPSTKSKIQELLSNGADPDACCNFFGGTALHETARSDNAIVASALLGAGATVDRSDNLGMTPLHYTAFWGAPRVAKVLIEAGADVNVTDETLQTPLHIAASWGYLEVARLLVMAGADINAKDVQRDTPGQMICSIACIIENAEEELKMLLLPDGAPSPPSEGDNDEDEEQRRLDEELLRLGDTGENAATEITVKELLSKGANPDACCHILGGSVLHKAALQDNAILAIALIEAGADVNQRDSVGRTALHVAALVGSPRVAIALIEGMADVNARSSFGEVPLHDAAKFGSEAVAEALIQAGADVNVKDNTGGTPLHAAARWGKVAVGRLLVVAQADIDAADNDGRTPLHHAAQWGQVEMAELLLEAGADKSRENNDGRVPGEVICDEFCARESDDDELKELLF